MWSSLKSAYLLALILLLAGIMLLISLFGYLSGLDSLLSRPGEFLFTSFLWASLFVPAYLFSISYFIISRTFNRKAVLILNLFILPFITVGLLQKVILSNNIPSSFLPELLIKTFGPISTGMLLLILIIFEFFLIFYAARGGHNTNEDTDEIKKLPVPETPEPVEVKVLDRKPDEEGAGIHGWIEDAELEETGQSTSERKSPGEYIFPVHGLLKEYSDGEYWEIDKETMRSAEVLMATLKEFNITAEVTGIRKGPVIAMFEILPAPGVKISRIANLADNIALRLAASRVRIVAPIPGKHAVGIEVPNKKRAIVSFKEMVILHEFQKSKTEIPIALGKDIAGEAQLIDLTQTPHMLIAGATGSGKSVCVNSIICSILYKKSPAEVRFILIDPKIVELKVYNHIPHLLTPVITDPKRAFQALQYCLVEMERRYSMLDALEVRDIRSYNRKINKAKVTAEKMPYWIIIIDEFADLIATTGKEMEATLARLASMARAVGMHLVLATQRPSIDVITGLIKANIPTRIAFMVAGKFDSRIIIDSVGAEKLLGQGDMLFSAAWDPVLKRIQGAFLSEEEVEAIANHARSLGEPDYLDEEIFFEDEDGKIHSEGASDPLMDKALDIVLAAGRASASYLQRRLKIGYNRAARIIEEMEMRGIVGPANGSKPREILHVPDRQ